MHMFDNIKDFIHRKRDVISTSFNIQYELLEIQNINIINEEHVDEYKLDKNKYYVVLKLPKKCLIDSRFDHDDVMIQLFMQINTVSLPSINDNEYVVIIELSNKFIDSISQMEKRRFIPKHDLSNIMNTKSSLEKNIYVLSGVFSHDMCDHYITFFENQKQSMSTWDETNNVFCNYVNLSHFQHFQCKENLKDYMIHTIIDIVKVLNEYINYNCCGYEHFSIRKIYGPTKFHCDGVGNIPKMARNMAMIVALNSDYEGGEFCFPVQNCKIKLEKGDILLFPPYWTHPHMVNAPKGNTYRYTINTWLLA